MENVAHIAILNMGHVQLMTFYINRSSLLIEFQTCLKNIQDFSNTFVYVWYHFVFFWQACLQRLIKIIQCVKKMENLLGINADFFSQSSAEENPQQSCSRYKHLKQFI